MSDDEKQETVLVLRAPMRTHPQMLVYQRFTRLAPHGGYVSTAAPAFYDGPIWYSEDVSGHDPGDEDRFR